MPLIARLSNLSISSGVASPSSPLSSGSSRDDVMIQPAPRGRRPQRRLWTAPSAPTEPIPYSSASPSSSSDSSLYEAHHRFDDRLPYPVYRSFGMPAAHFPESPAASVDGPSRATSYGRSCDMACTHGQIEPGTPVVVDNTAFLVVDIASVYGRLPPAYGPSPTDDGTSHDSAPPLYDSSDSLPRVHCGPDAFAPSGSSGPSTPTTPTFPTTPRDLSPPSVSSSVSGVLRGKPSTDSLASAWRAVGIDVNDPSQGPRPHCKPSELLDALDSFFGTAPSPRAASDRSSMPSDMAVPSSSRLRKLSTNGSTLNLRLTLGLGSGSKEERRRRASAGDLLQSFSAPEQANTDDAEGQQQQQDGEGEKKKGGRCAKAVRRLKLAGWTS